MEATRYVIQNNKGEFYWKEAILKIWKMHQYIKPEFSCTLCKAKVNPPTCNGCPVYY